MKQLLSTLLLINVFWAGAAKAQEMTTEYLIEATHQYWSFLGLIDGPPDANWSSEDEALLNRFRSVNEEHGRPLSFLLPNPRKQFANPLHAGELLAMRTVVWQQTPKGRKRGLILLTEGEYTLRAHPSLQVDHTGGKVLPLDWCLSGNKIPLSIEIPRDPDVVFDLRRSDENHLYTFFEKSVVPFLLQECPQAFEGTSKYWDGKAPAFPISLSLYVRDLEFMSSTIPSTCPGEGHEAALEIGVAPIASRYELFAVSWGFRPLVEAGGGIVTFSQLSEYNRSLGQAPICNIPEWNNFFPLEEVIR